MFQNWCGWRLARMLREISWAQHAVNSHSRFTSQGASAAIPDMISLSWKRHNGKFEYGGIYADLEVVEFKPLYLLHGRDVLGNVQVPGTESSEHAYRMRAEGLEAGAFVWMYGADLKVQTFKGNGREGGAAYDLECATQVCGESGSPPENPHAPQEADHYGKLFQGQQQRDEFSCQNNFEELGAVVVRASPTT
ncbi:hypothetical protein BC830DRAFT_1084309 [Chytriomyces sp. MP71]|nr:hypothetical protein BC830DRAFT_1084309 [Chytriomyces sp. MP71]